MLDVLLEDAVVVDGTGAPARPADVGIRDGRIVSLGRTDEPAKERVDVDGLVVAPGVVDIHTHYDAQLMWDPSASPSPMHGVTTAIGGNCGFTLAPAGPEHAEYLTRMMARVEGIPLEALQSGVSWDWRTFSEYLTKLDGRVAVNAGFLVGHSAMRRVVMGERAVSNAATDDDIAAMCRTLHDALDAGGLGLSTSQGLAHHDGDGNPVPSRAASREEVLALAAVVREHEGTTLETILAGSISGFRPDEMELMADMSLCANRPLNWNLLSSGTTSDPTPAHQLEASDVAAARGGRVLALTLPASSPPWITFLNGFGIEGLPGWGKAMSLPPAERVRAIADPEVRRELAAGAASAVGLIAGLARWDRLVILETFSAQNEGLVGRRIGDIAQERGGDPFEVLCQIALADELRTGLTPAGRLSSEPPDREEWARQAALWKDPRVIVGGSDAGAHVAMMCGAIYSTFMLGEAVRDRQTLTLEEAVHLLSDVPARVYGLRGRGRIAEGWYADLIVFDPERIAPGQASSRADLPGGATRLYADAEGIERVLVNGVEIVRDGSWTGATPGTLLRSGAHTDTVTVPGAR